jgi:hypothetical protein
MENEYIFDYNISNNGIYRHLVITLDEIECGGLHL